MCCHHLSCGDADPVARDRHARPQSGGKPGRPCPHHLSVRVLVGQSVYWYRSRAVALPRLNAGTGRLTLQSRSQEKPRASGYCSNDCKSRHRLSHGKSDRSRTWPFHCRSQVGTSSPMINTNTLDRPDPLHGGERSRLCWATDA